MGRMGYSIQKYTVTLSEWLIDQLADSLSHLEVFELSGMHLEKNVDAIVKANPSLNLFRLQNITPPKIMQEISTSFTLDLLSKIHTLDIRT
jgi:hypothetical protein